MKNKDKDVLYCGVSHRKIQKASPEIDLNNLLYLLNWVTERYKIHLNKDVYNKPYITKDPILAEYRFTNVRREFDRQTIWLIENIALNDSLSYKDKLLNCILFRLFNKSETLMLIKAPIKFFKSEYNPEDYRKTLESKLARDPKYVFFTSAFITGGMKSALKWYLPEDESFMPMRVMKFMEYLISDNVCGQIRACTSQKAVFDVLRQYMGIGDFLAYQIFVDFTYIDDFPFSENEFVSAGPGCKKGLDYIFIDKDGMNYEEALFWLRNHIDGLFQSLYSNGITDIYWSPNKLFSDIPKYDRYLNIMSLENCMCELSKYIKAITGKGRPRNKYTQTRRSIWKK